MASNYIDIPAYGDVHWKSPVATAAALPTVGNSPGDVRVTLDTDYIYIWTGSAWILTDTTNSVLSLNGLIGNLTITGEIAAGLSATTVNPIITINQQQSDSTHNGYLSAADWSTFNNKEDKSASNYITNPGAEIDTVGWNLYNNVGRTVPASLTNQDLNYTSTLSGDAGNGVEIEYIYNAAYPAATPNINVISSSHVQVQWNNGPTIANNPTATQLVTAWNAVSAATAIATIAITGTASKLQYITGAEFLKNGGDTSPTTGTGGSVTGVTLTRNTSTPLIGIASFDLGKDANSREGSGVSTDFVINSIDKNKTLQINFVYQGSSGMILGVSSDARVFVYDIDNANLLPVTPLITLAGPINTPKQFAGVFTTTSGSNYRLILHIATTNTSAWDLLFDSVVVTDELNPVAATQVPSVVLQEQPISGAVTDHMCVMWQDGASAWIPATIAGAALPSFGDDQTQLGFATNIAGLTADVYVAGFMDGFSFGPFTGYQQYIDNVAGGISPLPSPFTDLYCIVGTAISSTVLNIGFVRHVDLIANSSGVPIKGGLLTSSAVNDGTGDLVLSPGTNGAVPYFNSVATLGISTGAAVVVAAPFTYTTATRTLAVGSQTANTFYAAPNGGAGVPSFRAVVAADIPTLNQNTTGSAAKWTTARNLAGNSVDGSTNVAFANKFIVQGIVDAGLSAAQFLGALGTGIVKNTTTTGVLSIAVAGDFPTLNQNTTGSAATLTTARTIAGTNFNGSANIALANKFIVQGTADAGLSSAQFLGALATGLIKNTTSTGVLTAAAASDVTGQLLTGFTLTIGGGTVAATDSILQGIQKLIGEPQIKTGTNGKIGTATLVAGTVTVANTSVTANSRIFVTSNTDGGIPGWLRVSAKTVATSFVITSSSATDTSTVAWIIVESIP